MEKKNCIHISVFGYENVQKFPMYVSKNTFKRVVDLVLIEEVNLNVFLSKILVDSCSVKH